MAFTTSPRAKDLVLTPQEPSTSYVDATSYESSKAPPPHERDRRNRVLSDAERRIAEHPREARESFASIDANDAMHWHLQSLDNVQKALGADFERGLDNAQHAKRLEEHGLNKLQEDPRAPVYIIFLLQFYNLIIGILLVAAIASFFLGKTVEGIAIFIIVNMNALIATVQENNANNALEALAQLSSPLCTVLRDGERQLVESETLVPGDVVVLTTGDIVPADIRLIVSVDLKVNEMLLTGESEDVAKKYNASLDGKSTKLTADNMVFSSTTVTTGNARGVVVETGMSTRVGSIAALLKNKAVDSDDETKKKSLNPLQPCLDKYETKMTPLQESLHKLGALIGTFAVCVCALVFVLGLLRDIRDVKNPDRQQWITMVMVAVALAVSAVPSGLPMVVTICLSVGTAAMIKKNVLVRKLAAVETLGAASVICTDKTGTLTEGKMTAIKMWGDFKQYEITGKGFVPEGRILLNDVSQAENNVQVRATLLSCLLCSNTHLKQQDVDGVLTWVPQGNSSEAPLVVAAAKAGLWEHEVAEQFPRVVEVPFSSSRKMMITVNSLATPGVFGSLDVGAKTRFVASVKGAPNYILKNCTRFVQTDGTIAPLSEQQRAAVMEAVDELSSQALRVLAVAVQPLAALPFAEDCDDIDEKFAALSQPLVLLGLMASIDPERDGVRDAIATARDASVRTVMITGDYLKTAVAIAKNIDLLGADADPHTEAADCSRLRPRGDQYLPDHELDEITSRVVVFARAKPEDKIEIVKSLQRQGLVAAMTGDGVNDAPALKEADIGVAMGLSGTEVAKGASDMILLDDNFVSIVAAVERGRVIYANIQKFVIFLLSTNIGEILLIFGAVAMACPLPMEPLQILMVNLFTDGMPGAALSMERGETTIMRDKPRPKAQALIHGRLWKVVLFNAVFIAAGVFTVFLLGVYWNFGVIFLDDILSQGAGPITVDGETSYVGVTCSRWMGFSSPWKTYGNCAAQYNDGSPVFPGLENELFFENATVYCEGDAEYTCLWEGIARAQTMTFVAMTFTEVFRAYTVRNLAQVMFVQMFTNGHLQAAVGASMALTIFITNTPVIMDDVFGFGYITAFQWFVAFLGAVNAAFLGELLKWVMRCSARRRARRDGVTAQLDAILSEMRQMRHRVDRIEAAPSAAA